jgi:transposase
MPRFKAVHKGLKLLPVDFDKQIQVGSFEHAVCYLVDHDLDVTVLHARYKNDAEGAPAFDPGVLLKIVLLAYSRGIVSSRRIEAACRENVLFIAVSGDSQPHFTTLAAFVSELGDLAAKLFAQVLIQRHRYGCRVVSEHILSEIATLNSEIEKIRSKRNKFSHFCWCRSNDEAIFGSGLSGHVPPSKQLDKDSIVVTVKELDEMYKHSYSVVSRLSELVKQLPQVPEK